MNNKNSVPVFSIILINHNNTRHTIPCLKHLVIQSFQNFEVIVIENGSNTDQIKELEEYIININNNHENVGKIKFFKATNNSIDLI